MNRIEMEIPGDYARAVARVSNEYFVQAAVNFAKIINGELLTALVFLTIKNENIRHIEHLPKSVRSYWGADGSVPDSERAPTTVFVVSNLLGLNYETARRHAKRLLDDGYCTRVDRGLIVPAAVLARPEVLRANERNLAYFNELLRNAVDDGLIRVDAQPD